MSGLHNLKSPSAKKNGKLKGKTAAEMLVSKKEFDDYFEREGNTDQALQIIEEKMKAIEWNMKKLQELTGLSKQVCQGLCNTDKPHELWVWMSVFIGLRFSRQEIDLVMKLIGMTFRDNDKTHVAYVLLIKHAQQKELTIQEANEFLTMWGISGNHHLGSKTYSKTGTNK